MIRAVKLLVGKVLKKSSDYIMRVTYDFEIFKKLCANRGYGLMSEKERVVVKLPMSHFYLRKNSSDAKVFKQVMLAGEYQPAIDLCKNNHINVRSIIDCGANIGASSIFFKLAFPGATIVAVEADKENFMAASENLSPFYNIHVINQAVWFEKTQLTFDRNFRDKEDWSIRVKPAGDTTSGKTLVLSNTIENIMMDNGIVEIDLLKVDIEGAEKDIFTKPETCDFLTQTKVIALEIHDEFDCREAIYNVLHFYGFIIINIGETTLAMNKTAIVNN